MWRILENIEKIFEKGDCVYFSDNAFVYEADLDTAMNTVGLIGYCNKDTGDFYWSGVVDNKDPGVDNEVTLVQMRSVKGTVVRALVWVNKLKHFEVEE